MTRGKVWLLMAMSMAEEKEWKATVARDGKLLLGPEWRTTEGWELKPPWVEM